MNDIREIRIVRCKNCLHAVNPAELGEEVAGTMYDDAVKCSLFQTYRAGRGFCSCGAAEDPNQTVRTVDIDALKKAIMEQIENLEEATKDPKTTIDIGLKPYRIGSAKTLSDVLTMLDRIK